MADKEVQAVKTSPEAETPAEESIDIESEKNKYLKKLKRWRIVKNICFFAAFMTGLFLGTFKNSMVMYIPAFIFGIAGGPLLHTFAPAPHEKLAGSIQSDEQPTRTGVLFIIFIALLLLGFIMMTSDASNVSDKTSSGDTSTVSDEAKTE